MGFAKESGQSLIEVLVVLAVTIIIVVALTMAVLVSLKNAQFAQNQSKATKYAQQSLEKIRNIRDRDEDGEIFFQYSPSDTVIRKFSGLWGVNMSTRCSGKCYFKFDNSGILTSTNENSMENLEGNLARQITLTDEAGFYATEKKVSVKVKWLDSSGEHESNLETRITPLGCQESGAYCNNSTDCCSNNCLQSSGTCQ